MQKTRADQSQIRRRNAQRATRRIQEETEEEHIIEAMDLKRQPQHSVPLAMSEEIQANLRDHFKQQQKAQQEKAQQEQQRQKQQQSAKQRARAASAAVQRSAQSGNASSTGRAYSAGASAAAASSRYAGEGSHSRDADRVAATADPHIPRSRSHLNAPQAPKESHVLRNVLLVFFLVVVLVGTGVVYRGYTMLQSLNTYQVVAHSEPYELKEGATLATVVRDLASRDYPEPILKLWVKLNHGYYPMIQQGKYAIDGVKTLPQILSDMREGNVIKIKLPKLALIEGMTVTTVLRRLAARTDLVQSPYLESIFANAAEFIQRTLVTSESDQSLLQAIGGTHASLEGLLMPATYDYEPEHTVTIDLVGQALTKMATFMRERYIDRDQSIDQVLKSPYEVLILASIVERESSLESERNIIAGVFLNRLKRGIMLQTDPTVMYGVSPDFKGPLRRSQLRHDTPYNTYTRVGLPPTPIAMPSESAIMAVLHPAETNALFFVAKGPDPQDGHLFSATLREHNKAVAAYRKAVREYKAEQQEQQ